MTAPEPTRYWFPAKRYGWGWGMPRTWQGIAVLLGYIAVVTAPVALFPGSLSLTLLTVAVGTALLLWICLKKGEPTSWRWGGER